MKTHTRSLALVAGVAALALFATGCNKAQEATVMTKSPLSETASANVADSDVTTNVKTAFLQDTDLKGLTIDVETLKGDVRLSGVVDTQTQIDSAVKVAKAANGVHSVHDELKVKQ